jgi:tetratricopeptide (TPR) repeat protein
MVSTKNDPYDAQIIAAHDLAQDGEPDEALRMACNILNENPNEPRALFLAAYVFLQAERFGMAYNVLKRASEIVPFREQVWNNLGMACMKMGLIDEARKYLNKAMKINPRNSAAINNMALICVNEGEPKKAISLADKSLAINPDQFDIRETKGYASLMLGNWQDGWEGYEAMIGQNKQRTATPRKDVPYWSGKRGSKLCIRGEQGIGDEISFASVINDAAKDNTVILECDRRLEGLFRRSFPNITVHGTRFDKSVSWDKDFDAWCA